MALEDVLRDLAEKNHNGIKIPLEDLKQIVDQMSVRVGSSQSTLLYSGTLGTVQGTPVLAWQGAEHIGESSSGRIATIGQTDAVKLLQSKEFRTALKNSVGPENVKTIYNGETAPDGTRIRPGLWDNVSERFVLEHADKPTITLTPFARVDGVFAQTELPAIIDNPGNLLEGLDRDLFAHIRDTSPEGILDAKRVVSSLSAENAQHLTYTVDANGRVVGVDTSRFLGPDFDINPPTQTTGTTTVSQADLFASMDDIQVNEFKQGVQILDDVAPGHKISFLDNIGKNGGFFIGIGVGTGFAINELIKGNPAQAAEKFTESAAPYGETAYDILIHQDLDAAKRSATIETMANVGSVAGCAVVGFVGGAAGSVVPVAGNVAGGAAGCLVGGAAGGVAFGTATAFVYDSYDTIKEGVSNTADKISDLFNKAVDWFEDEPPELNADDLHEQLPDEISPDMPPEVQSLILVKPNRDLFNRQFEEVKDYDGLPIVETYLAENQTDHEPSEALDHETAPNYAGPVPVLPAL